MRGAPLPSEKRPPVTITLDDKGVPLSDYGRLNGVEVGVQRSIVAVAEKGLDFWNRLYPDRPHVLLSYSWENGRDWRTANGGAVETEPASGMLNCAKWLMENADTLAGCTVWRYRYPSFYGTKPRWLSAHAQGQAIRLLFRAYDETKIVEYREAALSAVHAFYITIELGGMTERLSDDHWWYHKFADLNSTRPRVLNGMMFTLMALHEVYAHCGLVEARDLFERGALAVIKTVDLYDQGEWSAHTPDGRPASSHYHLIHCRQLAWLDLVMPTQKISNIVSRWQRGDTSKAMGGSWN
jgi:hypothetical protein